MKASRRNPADILAIALLSVGALSLGLLSLGRSDLVSEPFGSLLVLSRSVSAAATLGLLYHGLVQNSPQRGYVRVRA